MIVWAESDTTEAAILAPIEFAADVDGGRAPLQYSWNFGDGTDSRERNPAHTFAEAGTYLVDMHVTDARGEVDTDFLEIEIE